MELNLNLDSLKFANVTSFTRTYGTKKTGSQNGGSLTTKEFNEVNALPFDTQRPIVLTENTIVSNAQYDAKLMVNAANITVTLRTESGTDGIVLMIATMYDTSVIVGDVTYIVKAGDVARFMYFNSTWNYINQVLTTMDKNNTKSVSSLAVNDYLEDNNFLNKNSTPYFSETVKSSATIEVPDITGYTFILAYISVNAKNGNLDKRWNSSILPISIFKDKAATLESDFSTGSYFQAIYQDDTHIKIVCSEWGRICLI